MPTTVLFVSHNHPTGRPGGAEIYAHALFEAFDRRPDHEAWFLAKGGPPVGYSGRHHAGTMIAPVGDHPRDHFLHTDGYTYDWLNGTITDKDFYTDHVAKFLAAVRPDVVHIQHTSYIGYDLVRTIRNVLPDAVIVYTLHEYMPICHRDGQMVRTVDGANCRAGSPRRCHECFPHVTPQQFFLRGRFIRSNLALVDRFVAPSRFLLERYVEWGIDRDRIVYEDYGREMPAPVDVAPRGRRDRFAFFGQANQYKGLDVLLDAFRLLADEARPGRSTLASLLADGGGDGHDDDRRGARPRLSVHGANLELQSAEHRERIDALLAATSRDVTWAGRYRPEELPALMAATDWVVVPSIWWENSPLVIQEAFHHGRPVICSDIGCMAEKVSDGVDGLHFRARDPRDLAAVIRTASTTPGLWDRLRRGIRPVHPMDDHVDRLADLYADLRAARRPVEVARVG